MDQKRRTVLLSGIWLITPERPLNDPVFRRHSPLMVTPLARYLQAPRRESFPFEPQALNQPPRCLIIGLNARF
jgi:hypothetical protein